MTSYLNSTIPNLPRGLRNNNPGNLIQTNIPWNGKVPLSQNTDSRFEQFYELRYGIRALMLDLYNDFYKGKNTVTQLISEFAPHFENNTDAYINSVINGIGSNVIGTLTEEKLIGLSKAIVLMENGVKYKNYITDNDYKQAVAILGKPLKKKA